MNFTAGTSINIKVGIDLQMGSINNLQNTTANLTIYDPNGNIWATDKASVNITTGQIVFSDIANSASNDKLGTYRIQIIWTNGTIAGGAILSFNLNPPPSYTWLYYAIPAVLIIFVFAAIIIKQNVLNPRKHRQLALIEQKTQMLTDLQNLRVIMILQKASGLPLFSQMRNSRQNMDETLLTGFCTSDCTLFCGFITKAK